MIDKLSKMALCVAAITGISAFAGASLAQAEVLVGPRIWDPVHSPMVVMRTQGSPVYAPPIFPAATYVQGGPSSPLSPFCEPGGCSNNAPGQVVPVAPVPAVVAPRRSRLAIGAFFEFQSLFSPDEEESIESGGAGLVLRTKISRLFDLEGEVSLASFGESALNRIDVRVGVGLLLKPFRQSVWVPYGVVAGGFLRSEYEYFGISLGLNALFVEFGGGAEFALSHSLRLFADIRGGGIFYEEYEDNSIEPLRFIRFRAGALLSF